MPPAHDPTGRARAPGDVPAPRPPARISGPQLLQAYLFLVSSLLVAGVFLFTYQMVNGLSREVATSSRVLARFCAQASFPAATDPALHAIIRELVDNVDFPIVITDNGGIPRAWRAVGIDPASVDSASIDSLTLGLPIAPVMRARLERVRARAFEMDRRNPPIPMRQPGTDLTLGAVHYGEPDALERLRWMPFIAGGGLVLLISLGFWGLTGIRQAEKRSIWVGMARETAHQLGTPLSALLGWIELLRSHGEAQGEEVRLPRADFAETLDEMKRDVERLTRVAQRFSHVGSAPQLQLRDVTPIVRDAVQYLRRRLGRAESEVLIRERYQVVPPILLNAELIAWALENLVNNAVSALDKKPGVLEIGVEPRADGEGVEVTVTDNGRGMTAAEQRRAFEPGYTTKRRGWGLGLALARRVVQDYHGGRLVVRHSAPGQGTTMVIRLPKPK
ncbi:MAG: HAMP domain-containing histidine kinase [Candidatus Eisenbacteria bacterium]|uniref:histidine kinase n=1 Tax=Eiseniibacteriota bacterium TaxID=2212470 RepID=A0A538U9R1_UNCEI|nr:MAG: HAMP domain-containing histidine kinase [Candidatus Eisenbacteria bacterium]